MTTYPHGYAGSPEGMGTQLTIEECEQQETIFKLHPEVWRRFSALMVYAATQGVPLGVGTGWRIQPHNAPGHADPGNSNHEGFPADGTSGGAVAIDTVPEPSWSWMEWNLDEFGLRSFRDVNDEPWHVQPIEIPAGRDWRTEPWDLTEWPLEDDVTDEDISKIVNRVMVRMKKELPEAVWDHPVDTAADDGSTAQPAKFWLHRGYLVSRQYLGGFSGDEAPKITVLRRIDENVRKLLDRPLTARK